MSPFQPGVISPAKGLIDYRGGTVWVFGDSIATGFGASTEAAKLMTIVRSATGWELNNQAGAGLTSVGAGLYGLATNSSYKGSYVLMMGLNDTLNLGDNANAKTTYGNGLRALISWLGTPEGNKIEAQEAGWSYTGTWADLNIYNLNGKFTTTVGNKANITISGSTIHIGYLANWDTVTPAPYTIFTAKVDGITLATVNSGIGNSKSGDQKFTAYLLRFTGLSPGSHAVELTHAGTAGKAFAVCWISSNANITNNYPDVYVGNLLKPTAAGYASQGGLTNDAFVDNWNAINLQAAADMASDGLFVHHMDWLKVYDRAIHTGADGLHPNDAGNAVLADFVLKKMKAVTCEHLRKSINTCSN